MAGKIHITPALIRQYLNGELDDRTMHALEKQALDDPFLAEALEGYSGHPADQEPALLDLRSRLEKRVQEPAKKRGMYVRWLAAASVLIIVVIGSLLLLNRPQQTAVVQDLPKKEDVAPAPPVDTAKGRDPRADELPEDSNITAQKAAAPSDMDSKKASVQKEKALARNAPEAAKPAIAMTMEAPAPPPPESVVRRELKGLPGDKFLRDSTRRFGFTQPKDTIYIGRRLQQDTDLAARSRQEGYIAGEPRKYNDPGKESDYHLISGVVIDAKTGAILPGASVTVKGTDRATITDTAGRYSLKMHMEDRELVFGSVGYEKKNISVSPFSQKLDVSLPAQRNDRIMIRGIAAAPGPAKKSVYLKPEPVMGEEVYKIYLQAMKTITSSGTPVSGEVRISFTVMPDSTLRNFKILRSLSKEADEAAIRHVKDGPKWIPTSDKRKSVVKLTIPIEIKSK